MKTTAEARLTKWFSSLARAAIEAMREPTEGMIAAGQGAIVCHAWSSSGEYISNPEDPYQAMITEALK